MKAKQITRKCHWQKGIVLQQSKGTQTVLVYRVVHQGWSAPTDVELLKVARIFCKKTPSFQIANPHQPDCWTWPSHSVSDTSMVMVFEGGGWKGFLCYQESHPALPKVLDKLGNTVCWGSTGQASEAEHSTAGDIRHIGHQVSQVLRQSVIASISHASQLGPDSSLSKALTRCFLKLWSRRGMASFRNASTKRRPYYQKW